MNKIKILLVGMLLAVCFAPLTMAIGTSLPKKYTLNEEQGAQLFTAIEVAKKGLSTSTEVSAAEASKTIQILAGIQKVIQDQHQLQATAEAKVDSTKVKKPIK